MEGLSILGRRHVGSPSLGVEDLRSLDVNHVELESAVHQPIRGHGRCTSEGAQHFGDARQKEELPGLDPVQSPQLCGLVSLPLVRRV